MSQEVKILAGIGVVTVLLLLGGVLLLNKGGALEPQSGESSKVYDIDYSKGEKLGSDSAKVKLAEFSDLQCPACALAQPYVKQVLDKNGAKLQFVYIHYPLPQHLHGKEAAEAAEAAGAQGKFWQMHDKLFETQQQWSNLPSATDYFVSLAKDLGLDGSRVKEAVEKNTYEGKIQSGIDEGSKASVNATPTFFLNGRKLNLNSFSDLQTEVDKALAK